MMPMKQLKFDKDFKKIIEEKEISYWKTMDEVDEKILKFLKDISFSRLIYNRKNRKYYCPNCFTKVRNHLRKCPKCHHQLLNFSLSSTLQVDDIDEKSFETMAFYYYAFSIQQENVLLYKFKEDTYLYNSLECRKISSYEIAQVLLIKKKSVVDLLNECEYYYEDFERENQSIEREYDENSLYKTYDFFLEDEAYLYLDNLIDLKNTIYEYSLLWEFKKYLKDHKVYLADITYLPLYDINFEYLAKYKLYNLAFNSNHFTFKGSFKKTFHLDKKFLPFMVKYDLNFRQYIILSLIKKEDIKLIKKLENYDYWLENIFDEFDVDILKIIEYFNQKKISYEHLIEYNDYLGFLKNLGIDWHNKKYLFPKNLFEAHDKFYKQCELISDKKMEERIRKIARIYQINQYEDDAYIIFPAPSLDSLIMESRNQNNCVRTYAKKYSEGECTIYFMREKKNLDKSLVTIEVVDGKVVQAREKNNKLVRDKYQKVIDEFAKNLC